MLMETALYLLGAFLGVLILLLVLWKILFSQPNRSGNWHRQKTRRQWHRKKSRRKKVRLVPLRYRNSQTKKQRLSFNEELVPEKPYLFAIPSGSTSENQKTEYNDFTGERSHLPADRGLPLFHTPTELAEWLDIPVGQLAWLTHRTQDKQKPETEQTAHYYFRWIRKRSGGWRLLESPKSILKQVQRTILTEILQNVPPHENAHGFVPGRSIITNAKPHVGKQILVKFDLQNFYATISFSRVVAIFRRIGYCREAALWLARLTTSALPRNMAFPENDPYALHPFLQQHLPQGAPTSPAIANLSALSLDVRLSGLANCFQLDYTRYADDITFSSKEKGASKEKTFAKSLKLFLPLVTKIIRDERFVINLGKRKVIRANQRQTVTGVVVNEKLNVSRRDYDRLKAILTNCLRHGPASQNRAQHEQFAAHLQGRIAHLSQLNRHRGAKLLALFNEIHW